MLRRRLPAHQQIKPGSSRVGRGSVCQRAATQVHRDGRCRRHGMDWTGACLLACYATDPDSNRSSIRVTWHGAILAGVKPACGLGPGWARFRVNESATRRIDRRFGDAF